MKPKTEDLKNTCVKLIEVFKKIDTKLIEVFKKIGAKLAGAVFLLYPPIWLMAILTVISAAALTAVFVKGLEESVIAYVSYAVSFYTLTVICIFCSKVLPKRYRSVRHKIYTNPIGNRYMTDAAFKTHVWLYISLGINLLFVAVNLIPGFLFGSLWFITLAFYYIILAVMRFLLVRFANENGLGKKRSLELRRARLCSIILLTLNLALSGVVVLVILKNEGFEYPGFLIYAVAMYTFYITIGSIIDMVKYRKYKSPVMSTAKAIDFTAALVSMLALEIAMLTQFGVESSEQFKMIMIAATGAAVSITVTVVSLYLAIRTTQEIKYVRK